MTDCEKIAELLSAYYDGELTDSECELVREHVDECESCAALLRFFGDVTDTFSDIEPPPELRERVMSSVRAVKPRRAVNTKRIILWRVVPAAACLAVVLLALPTLMNSGKNDDAPMSSSNAKADMASPPMEAMIRAEVAEDEVDGEIMEEYDFELGALGDEYAYDSGTGAAESKTFGGVDDAQNSGASTAPQSKEGMPEPTEAPALETPAPQIAVDSADTSVSTTARAGEYSEYYAVIKIVGEFPQSLLNKLDADHPIGYNVATREQSVVISRDIADALIAEGYDYALYNADASEAVVIAIA